MNPHPPRIGDRSTRRGFLGTAGAAAAAAALVPPARAASAAQRHPHKYEEMLPEEFYAELKRAPIAYLPIGAMEEHGLQSVLAVDPWTAYEVCLRTAERAGGIVHPVVPIAPAGHPSFSHAELRSGKKDLAPPSFWVSRETCKRLYVEMLEMCADLGFKYTVAYSGHWPGEVLLAEIEKELGGVARGMKFFGGGMSGLLKDEFAALAKELPLAGGHGMMWETSVVMAIHREWVDLARVGRIKDSPLSHQLKDQSRERLDFIKAANARLGNRFLELTADRLADLARQALGS
jgi:creatinine amidohydrolase